MNFKTKLLPLCASALLVATPIAVAAPAKLKSQDDRVSYALGIELGEAFKSQGLRVTPNRLAQGMNDALSGEKYQIERKQIDQILIAFRKQQMAKQEQKINEIAVENARLGKKFMSKHQNDDAVKTTDSGIQYKVLKAGKGSKPAATDSVTVNYEGKFIDGQVFDSSYQRGEPTKFRLNQVIAGWTEALQLMQEGATWEIVIPPELAYGEHGMGGVIGPNETLVFKVELIKVHG